MFEILAERAWGQPKLNKLNELKLIKQVGSIPFGEKCKCPVFIVNHMVYIKHRDWFSPYIPIPEAVTRGIIDEKKKKFVYNDNFGSVVLRNEAWIKIYWVDFNIFEPELVNLLIRSTEKAVGLEEFDLENHCWVNFYEELIKLVKRFY